MKRDWEALGKEGIKLAHENANWNYGQSRLRDVLNLLSSRAYEQACKRRYRREDEARKAVKQSKEAR